VAKFHSIQMVQSGDDLYARKKIVEIKSGFLFYVPEEGIPEIRDGL